MTSRDESSKSTDNRASATIEFGQYLFYEQCTAVLGKRSATGRVLRKWSIPFADQQKQQENQRWCRG
uniref:Uncharacterized protein n=1 Tax=Ditylenchus dipsaci TaxID=166011 RepID=A0A915E2C4_9BILA